jgi:lipid II:glycine glycyltransferase (peptidoglycan interpeptide bridge formation enzyme)
MKAKLEEEQLADKKPAEALSRLSANVARPEDIQALQRTIGNRAVTNMIQRHPEDTSRIELLRHAINARVEILSNRTIENRDAINTVLNSTNENFTNQQNTLTEHSSRINENRARISSLESEEVVVPAAGGI